MIYINAFISILGIYLSSFLGDFDSLLHTLIGFVILDYFTGVLLAIHTRHLSSSIGFSGIFKKVFIFILVAIGNLLDTYIFTSDNILRNLIIFFYLSNEGISILENACLIGLPVPDTLRNIFLQLKDKKTSKKP